MNKMFNRSKYFLDMTSILKNVLLFKDESTLVSVFLWLIFPVTIMSWIGWLLADIFSSDTGTSVVQ